MTYSCLLLTWLIYSCLLSLFSFSSSSFELIISSILLLTSSSAINKYVTVTPIVAIIAATISFVANNPIINTIKILTIVYSK